MARTPRSTTAPRNFKCVNHHNGQFTVTWTDAEGSHKVTGDGPETDAVCQRIVKLILAGGPFGQ